MSKETWLKQYYPVAAVDAASDDLTAVDHSILKWTGAKAASLRAHGLNEPPVSFGVDSCALCQRYFHYGCNGCPLKQARDGVVCFSPMPGEESRSPYNRYTVAAEPEPMLMWLRAAREFVLKDQAKGDDNGDVQDR